MLCSPVLVCLCQCWSLEKGQESLCLQCPYIVSTVWHVSEGSRAFEMSRTVTQALDLHASTLGDAEAHEAMLVTLQCMHALMSGAGGMHGVLSTRGFLPAVCAVLARREMPEAAKLVVEILIKLCLFSSEGYCLAVKVCSV